MEMSLLMSRNAVAQALPVADNNDDVATRGSGNVFADLGFANPEEELLKANLVIAIHDQIERLKLSQTKAAAIMGISQPDVSKLLRGRTGLYSLERLLGFIRALGHDVEISVKAPPIARPARVSLRVAMELA